MRRTSPSCRSCCKPLVRIASQTPSRRSGPRRAYSSPARYCVRLKSEISFLPTRAAKTRTGVAVHENLLDSVMAAPLKRE